MHINSTKVVDNQAYQEKNLYSCNHNTSNHHIHSKHYPEKLVMQGVNAY